MSKGYQLFLIIAFFLVSCGSSNKIHKSEVISISDEIQYDPSFEREISPFREELKDSMSIVLANTKTDFVKNQPNGNLNNLISDIIFKEAMSRVRVHSIATNNTICLLNYGGLRAPINSGEVTVGTCFEVMPFENEIVIARLDKEQVKAMVELIKSDGGHPIANAKLTILEDGYDLLIGNTEYVPEFLYVITSDYLYKGGDNMHFFKGTKVVGTGYKIRDALINYFNENPTIDNVMEERIRL